MNNELIHLTMIPQNHQRTQTTNKVENRAYFKFRAYVLPRFVVQDVVVHRRYSADIWEFVRHINGAIVLVFDDGGYYVVIYLAL